MLTEESDTDTGKEIAMRFVMLIVVVSISIVYFSEQTQLPTVPTITEAPVGSMA